MVLASMICCSIHIWLVVTAVRYWRISLVDSVLPAPDSPLMITDWFSPFCFMWLKEASAMAKMWGGKSPNRAWLYFFTYSY